MKIPDLGKLVLLINEPHIERRVFLKELFRYWVEGVTLTTVSCAGVMGNIIS